MRKADRRGRARATLAWAAALFAAAEMGGSLLLDYAWPGLRFPSAAGVVRQFRRRPQAGVIILGSSRLEALVPGEMESLLGRCAGGSGRPAGVLNAWVPGGDAIASEYLLRQLLAAGARPDLVVVEVMPEFFTRHNEWHTLHVRRQLRWENLPEHGGELCRSGQMMRFLRARLLGPHVHRHAIRQALARLAFGEPAGPPPAAAAPAGPVDWEQTLRPPRLAMMARLAAALANREGPQRWLRNYHFGGNGTRALERLLVLCRERGVEVVLFAPPTTRMFRECYTPEIESAYQQYLAGLRRTFGCAFVDCRDWLDDALFCDGHHERAEGGLYFSRLLTHRVLLPWRQRHEPGTYRGLPGIVIPGYYRTPRWGDQAGRRCRVLSP
jgi:hypothetical protein